MEPHCSLVSDAYAWISISFVIVDLTSPHVAFLWCVEVLWVICCRCLDHSVTVLSSKREPKNPNEFGNYDEVRDHLCREKGASGGFGGFLSWLGNEAFGDEENIKVGNLSVLTMCLLSLYLEKFNVCMQTCSSAKVHLLQEFISVERVGVKFAVGTINSD